MAPHSAHSTLAELAAPATQFIADQESYLGQGRRDIGRRLSATEVELFVAGDTALALEQQLIEFAPDYVAFNDVAGNVAQGVLAALASSYSVPLQTLAIRRQGQGVALAELPFIELSAQDGNPVRFFGADINADSRTRQQVAQVLMAHSRLGVLLVSELPRHSIAPALAPWRAAISRGPWSNGDLLLVPLAVMPTLGTEAAHLGGRSGVVVELVDVAKRASDALAAVFQAWNRQQVRHKSATLLVLRQPNPHASAQEGAPTTPPPTWAAQTVPMGLDPTPDEPVAQASAPDTPQAAYLRHITALGDSARAAMPIPGGIRWDPHAQRVAALRGVVACCVFDQHSAQALAAAGGRPSGERLATQGAALVVAMSEAGRAVGVGPVLRDAVLTLGTYQMLLLAIPGHPGLWLHLVIDTQIASAALVRAMVEKLTP